MLVGPGKLIESRGPGKNPLTSSLVGPAGNETYVVWSLIENAAFSIYLAECTTTTEQQLRDYFGKPDYPVVHFPYNFKLAKPSYWYNAKTFDDVIMSWIGVIPEWATSNWMVSKNNAIGDLI